MYSIGFIEQYAFFSSWQISSTAMHSDSVISQAL